MTPDLPDAIRPLLARLGEVLRGHPDLRREVAAFAHALAAWADEPVLPIPAPPQPQPAEAVTPPAAPVPVPPPPPVRPPVDLSQLDLAAVLRAPPLPSAPAPPVVRGPGEIVPHDLPVIARRCRAKAEAARLVARDPGAVDRAAASALIAGAGAIPDCYLWMFDPNAVYSDRPKVWADLAGAFDTAAAVADLLAVWDEVPDADAHRSARDVLYLAAESQAVLYTAVADVGRRGRDQDQLELYISIKDRTKLAGVFVDRYMTITDPADAARWVDLARRVAECAGTLRGSEERTRQRKKALDRLKHKTRRLREGPAEAAEEWPRVVELLDELVAGGMAPSNSEVRDWLLPLTDRLPDDVPLTPAAAKVFREIDRFLASRPNGPEEVRPESWSAEVAEARRLLAGRVVVLIGGLVRPDRKAALVRAFDLDDLIWISTEEHESVGVFEAPIARPEVAVVLLAIRWSSHSYGDVQEFCDRYDKLLVRLPGGYHPNQVAHQLLSQIGDRLRTR